CEASASGRSLVAGSAEPRRRLADVLPGVGLFAVRPQCLRPDGSCAPGIGGLEAADRGALAPTSGRDDESTASGAEFSGQAAGGRRLLVALVVRQPTLSGRRQSDLRHCPGARGVPRFGAGGGTYGPRWGSMVDGKPKQRRRLGRRIW